MRKVCCLVPFDQADPSTRHRVYRIQQYLQQQGFCLDIRPFYSNTLYRTRSANEHDLEGFGELVKCYLRRVKDYWCATKADVVLVQRCSMPVGMGIPEFFLKRILRKRLIYDFDDALYLPKGRILARLLGSWRAVGLVVSLSDYVFAGNKHLAEYALRHNDHVVVVPTSVDVQVYKRMSEMVRERKTKETAAFVVGWIGTAATAGYLDILRTVLCSLAVEGPLEFRVIGAEWDGVPKMTTKFIPWSEDREIAELAQLDLGIAPMPDTEWTRGKCGFKIVQYMAAGIPVIASATGEHANIINHGETGFLANTEEEWLYYLRLLRDDPILRRAIGVAGQEKAEREYDVKVISRQIANILNESLSD